MYASTVSAKTIWRTRVGREPVAGVAAVFSTLGSITLFKQIPDQNGGMHCLRVRQAFHLMPAGRAHRH